MYERIQGNDMYNAGPNIPFSLNVNLNNVQLQDPNILLQTGAAPTFQTTTRVALRSKGYSG